MSNYSSTDMYWTNGGDFTIDQRGDLMDSSDNPLRSLVQEIRTRVEAEPGDWGAYPTLGAALDNFIGEPNNRALAQEIKARLRFSITDRGLVSSNDLLIDIVPTSNRMVAVMMRVNVSGTPGIERNIQWLVMRYLYDTAEKGLIFQMAGE
jgi:hypothetical protein